MNNYCKVAECRYKNTHTTKVHICGKCYQKGHGQLECSNQYLKRLLVDFYEDVIDVENRCDIPNCNEKKYHMTIAHKCESCFKFGHSLNECPLKIIEIKCPICRTLNNIPRNQMKVKGIDVDCSICFDKKVEIYMNNCGHLCICYDCLIQLSK
jgi:hypothetical protein